jgi:hypothetical protein
VQRRYQTTWCKDQTTWCKDATRPHGAKTLPDHLVQRPDHLVQRRYQIARPPGAKTLPDHLVQRPYLLVHAKQPSSMHKENPAGGRVGTMKERVITCQCCYNNAITCQCCYNNAITCHCYYMSMLLQQAGPGRAMPANFSLTSNSQILNVNSCYPILL